MVQDSDRENILGTASVNIDPRETALQAAGTNEMRSFFASLGFSDGSIAMISTTDEILGAVQESRFGIELWKHMLALAIFLALCEMAVARVTRKEQSGAEIG